MYISYDYYRIFYYVAKYSSFTKAATVLRNNQPNMTRAIKNLESELGCKLFVRSNRNVTLTPEGEKLYEHVSVAFHHIESAENELQLDKNLQGGSISIGATEVALHCFLLPILKQFREIYPGVRIRVSNHTTSQAIAALEEGLVDFAVVTTPVDIPRSAKQTILKEIQEVPVCGAAYAHLAEKKMSLKELTSYPMISLGSNTMTHAFYRDWFAKQGMMYVPDIEAATADQILPLVRHDLGIGFVPEEFLQNESDATGIYRLDIREKVPGRYVCLIDHLGHPLSIAAVRLKNMMVENIL